MTTDDVNEIFVTVRTPERDIRLEDSPQEYEPRDFDAFVTITGFEGNEPKTPEKRTTKFNSGGRARQRVKCSKNKLMPNFPCSAKD